MVNCKSKLLYPDIVLFLLVLFYFVLFLLQSRLSLWYGVSKREAALGVVLGSYRHVPRTLHIWPTLREETGQDRTENLTGLTIGAECILWLYMLDLGFDCRLPDFFVEFVDTPSFLGQLVEI